MPEVVNACAEDQDMLELERIKSSIIDTFKLDFNKYAMKANPRLLSIIYASLPTQIGKKIKYTNINSSYRSNEISKSLRQLCLARIALKVLNSSSNGIPLAAEKNERFFKCFMLDIGLIHSQLKINPFGVSETVELNLVNNDVLAKQLVPQQLQYQVPDFQEPELYY